jgi:hypothetical protein
MGLMAASMYGQDTGALAAAKAACGPGDPKFSVATAPPKGVKAGNEGKALLYVLEVQDHVAFCPLGCGETVKIGLDGAWSGATKSNSFLVLPVEPGEHHLCAEWDARVWRQHKHLELSSFLAESGKNYYFRVHITPATTDSIEAFHFDAINEDEGKLLVASRPQSLWTEK